MTSTELSESSAQKSASFGSELAVRDLAVLARETEWKDAFSLLLMDHDADRLDQTTRTLNLWFRGSLKLTAKLVDSLASACVTLSEQGWDFALIASDFKGSDPYATAQGIMHSARRLDTPVIITRGGDADEQRAAALSAGALECCNIHENSVRLDDRMRNLIGAFMRHGRFAKNRKQSGYVVGPDAALYASLSDMRERFEDEKQRASQLEGEKRRIRDAFGLYVDQAVIEGILNRDIPLEQRGVQRNVSVLFADIRGFTTIAESMKPLHVISFLNEFFTAMTEVIEDNHGMIDKYIGDSIMCLFGAIADDQPHAEQATKAAIAMQEVFSVWLPGWVRNYGFRPALGIGVATGPVILGNIGSFQKLSYTAIGDTVNLAARLENAAKPAEVYLAGATVDDLPTEFRNSLTMQRAELALKGKQHRCPAYQMKFPTNVPA